MKLSYRNWLYHMNFFIINLMLFEVATAQCVFPKHKQLDEEVEKHIQPLLGKSYKAKDQTGGYLYEVGICVNPLKAEIPDKKDEKVGVFQLKLENDKPSYQGAVVIGTFSNTDLVRGSGWVYLEYSGGEKYHSHCGSEERHARIMITCDSSVNPGEEVLKILAEENNKTEDCFYLFEMASSVVCPATPVVTFNLSLGSILVIVFVCVVFLYIVLGIAYNRFMLGAKGMEQLPNYSFWQDFGNLQADGCNLVCRAGGSPSRVPFKGIGDDQLQEDEDRDDHLLPM